jgi:Holliday junction resolvasome RuvABC DNA-binding subunit
VVEKRRLRDYSPSLVEAWATYECLRNLGFTPDEISWVVGQTLTADYQAGYALNVVLEAQGKTFTITCSEMLEHTEARQLEVEARAFYEALMSDGFSEEELKAAYHASHAWREKTSLVVAISAKGFAWPFQQN